MNTLKSTWVWLCRFRKRKGYGVHSPFAYDFIRTVINERGKYYAYAVLGKLRKGKHGLASVSVDRLLFRLANHFQPQVALLIGPECGLSLNYVQAGCHKAQCQQFPTTEEALSQLKQWKGGTIGLLYLTLRDGYDEVLKAVLPYVGEQTVIIVDKPYAHKERREWWHSLEKNPAISLSFDLYEVGLLLFCHTYSKQAYKVNFVSV